MNLQFEFEQAIPLFEYKKLLGEQSALHELHYRKAEINYDLPSDINLNILVITEPWCGDSTAIIPVIEKLLQNTNAEIRVALRDSNIDLMDRFLTNGGRGIPILILLDKDGNFLNRFGPRPSEPKAIFESYRQAIQDGKIEKSEVSKKIRTFYAKDRGKAILKDFIEILAKSMSNLSIMDYDNTALKIADTDQ